MAEEEVKDGYWDTEYPTKDYQEAIRCPDCNLPKVLSAKNDEPDAHQTCPGCKTEYILPTALLYELEHGTS